MCHLHILETRKFPHHTKLHSNVPGIQCMGGKAVTSELSWWSVNPPPSPDHPGEQTLEMAAAASGIKDVLLSFPFHNVISRKSVE